MASDTSSEFLQRMVVLLGGLREEFCDLDIRYLLGHRKAFCFIL